MFRFLLLAIFCMLASGFVVPARMAAPINDSIDKENPKVVHTLKVSEMPVEGPGLGKKAVYCRCWKSDKFPFCDAKHVKHNEATGDKCVGTRTFFSLSHSFARADATASY